LIETIYTERENFILIGLTGRIGSGCTTSANFLSQTLNEHNLRTIQLENNSTDNKRKKFIIDKFYRTKWKPFFSIRASDIITIFILKYDFDNINQILDYANNTLKEVKRKQNTEEELSQLEKRLLSFDEIIKLPEEIKECFNTEHDKHKNFLQQLDECNTSNIDNLYTLLNDIKKVSNILKSML